MKWWHKYVLRHNVKTSKSVQVNSVVVFTKSYSRCSCGKWWVK